MRLSWRLGSFLFAACLGWVWWVDCSDGFRQYQIIDLSWVRTTKARGLQLIIGPLLLCMVGPKPGYGWDDIHTDIHLEAAA